MAYCTDSCSNVVTALVRMGKLTPGCYLVSGTTHGRARALFSQDGSGACLVCVWLTPSGQKCAAITAGGDHRLERLATRGRRHHPGGK